MQKLLITSALFASLCLAGCSSGEKKAGAPEGSFLAGFSFAFRPDIQQGNLVTQDMVNQLKPGMSKRQVRFVMGTPMLVDSFHQDRWDYLYRLQPGKGPLEERKVILRFEGDSLATIEGDMRPEPMAADLPKDKETVVSVPDYDDPNKGIIAKAWDAGKKAVSGDGDTPDAAAPAPAAEPEKAAEEAVSPPR